MERGGSQSGRGAAASAPKGARRPKRGLAKKLGNGSGLSVMAKNGADVGNRAHWSAGLCQLVAGEVNGSKSSLFLYRLLGR